MKRIAAAAYEALRDALPVITWNLRPFESYLRTALRDSPEVLAGLNFKEPKRIVAGQLVDRLMANEDRYRDTTLALMLEVADMTEFPNIAQMSAANDRDKWLGIARAATAHLRSFTQHFAEHTKAREQAEVIHEANVQEAERVRHLAGTLERLRAQFLDMHADDSNPQRRGIAFEGLLSELFWTFDMEPRLSYTTDLEQIDGSLAYDTDDYVIEARWRATSVSREDADAFAAKVHRKGKNALGLFVSINGFSPVALTAYHVATPFLTVTGQDLYAVLDQRVRLDDLLRAKKRHANETGDCYYPVENIL